MTPSVESLAALLKRSDCAMLTVIDSDGRPRTRPMIPVKVPFNGHLWLRVGVDVQPASEIGRGADVSVAYAAGAEGPYVTVYGWAIVLRDPPPTVPRVATPQRPQLVARPSPPLICVSARAAEVWDAASSGSRRVFAFSHAHPVCDDDSLKAQERALAPRGALSLATAQ